MVQIDFASLALRPFIDLIADPDIIPSIMAEAPLHWVTTRDATGWSCVTQPPLQLRNLLMRAGAIKNANRIDAMKLPMAVAARFASVFSEATADPMEILWAARLLSLLGFREPVLQVLQRMGTRLSHSVHGWRDLLWAQHAQTSLPPAQAGSEDELPLALRFARLWLGLQRCNDDFDTRQSLLNSANLLCELADPPYEALIDAHTLAWRLSFGELPKNESIISRSRTHLAEQRAISNANIAYLLNEAERTLLLQAALHAHRINDNHAAATYANALIAIDPSAADAHFLAGEIALANDQPANAHYRTAIRYGVVEREMALSRLLDHAIKDSKSAASLDSLPAAIADVMYLHPGSQAERLGMITNQEPHLLSTTAGGLTRWAARSNLREPTESSSEFLPLELERLRPYLDLQQPAGLEKSETPPVVIHTPLMAWESLRQRRDPWFEAIHPQRIPPAPFRRELAGAAAFLGYKGDAATASLADWVQAADGCPKELRAYLDGAPDLSPLQRGLLARVLIALGFHRDGQALLPSPEHPVRNPEQAFARSTWIYAELILTSAEPKTVLEPLYRDLDEQLGNSGIYARLRMTNCFNAALSAFRCRDVSSLAYWRAEGTRALAEFNSQSEVDDFTSMLATSRFHRAMSFLPYLNGDKELLRHDMDQWLGIARELRGHDERTRILAADNLFPAIETAFRTEAHLGNQQAAMALVEELAYSIDPLDPKTWIQLAEFRLRTGDVSGALSAYLRAAQLTVPHARVAWFNAGQCYEKLGHPEDAVECYIKSLAHWPTGISPLRRIRKLATNGVPVTEAKLLLAWATRQPAWASIRNAA